MALEMCTLGAPVAADKALAAGIVDRIVEGDLLAGAIAFAREKADAGAVHMVRERTQKIADREAGLAACQAARAGLKKVARGAHAPYAAVDAIEAAVTSSFTDGSEREIELFADCVLSNESRSMVKLFFAEREVAKIPDVPKDTPVARDQVGGGGGRGHHGRRHYHDLRQRRHSR